MSWKRLFVTAVAIPTLVTLTVHLARADRWTTPVASAYAPAAQSTEAAPTPTAESNRAVCNTCYAGGYCQYCLGYPLSALPTVSCILDDRCYFYSPDYGWSCIVKRPIETRNTTYQKYWPQRWTGQARSQNQKLPVPRYPIVATPTDTAQLGYYYQQVPQWQPKPSMLPKPPIPSQWHIRGATSVSYGRGVSVCPLCRQHAQPASPVNTPNIQPVPSQPPPLPERPSASHGPSASNEIAPPPPPDFAPETRRKTALRQRNARR